MSSKNVTISNNNIVVNRLDHPACVSSFIRCMNMLVRNHAKEANIIFKCGKAGIFPDACLPIFVMVNRSEELFGLKCNVIMTTDYLKSHRYDKLLYLLPQEIEEMDSPLNKIFVYSAQPGYERQVSCIVQSYVDYLSKNVECEEGVLSGLIWCINEVMDNVLVHSNEQFGYIMAQYHKKKKRLAICVFDLGVGIYDTLKQNTKHIPVSEIDAISLALQEGVGDGQGQGNGLYGLHQIVNENGGKLTISSGNSALMMKQGTITHHDVGIRISNNNCCTVVDFQLDLSKKIDIKDALRTLSGFDGFDIRLDNMWQEDGSFSYDVYANSVGTGTRAAGALLRNDVLNTLKRIQEPIVLDFSGVVACSSSFIDEFIAKLFCSLGAVEFNSYIKIKGMNDTIQHLCDRSIAMRVHEVWEAN